MGMKYFRTDAQITVADATRYLAASKLAVSAGAEVLAAVPNPVVKPLLKMLAQSEEGLKQVEKDLGPSPTEPPWTTIAEYLYMETSAARLGFEYKSPPFSVSAKITELQAALEEALSVSKESLRSLF